MEDRELTTDELPPILVDGEIADGRSRPMALPGYVSMMVRVTCLTPSPGLTGTCIPTNGCRGETTETAESLFTILSGLAQ